MKCIFCDQEKKAWSITVTDDRGATGICRDCIGLLAEPGPPRWEERGDQFIWRLVEALKELGKREPAPPGDISVLGQAPYSLVNCKVTSITDVAISVATGKGKE